MRYVTARRDAALSDPKMFRPELSIDCHRASARAASVHPGLGLQTVLQTRASRNVICRVLDGSLLVVS